MQDISTKSFLIRDLLGDLLEGRHKNEGIYIIKTFKQIIW